MHIKQVITRFSVLALALVLTGLTAPTVEAGRVMKQDHRGSARTTAKRYGNHDGGGDRYARRQNRHDSGYRRHYRRDGGHYRGYYGAYRYARPQYYGHYGHYSSYYRPYYTDHRSHVGVAVGHPGFYIRFSR